MRALRSILPAALLCAALCAAGQAAAADPPENIPLGSEPSSCSAQASAACEEWTISRLDAARAELGLAPYALPQGFVAMPADRQLFVLADLDRTAYGYTPVYGLNTYLSEAAEAGVQGRKDPTPPSAGGPWNGFGSDWASAGGLIGYYLWMYDDGYGSPNGDCTSPGASGCWGHRHVILGEGLSLAQPELLGAAAEAGAGSALIVSSDGGESSYYTWAQAEREGAGSEGAETPQQPPPAVTRVSPASGPAGGGTSVRITGSELGDARSVHFGAVAATSFRIVSATAIVAVAPAGAAGSVDVTVTSSAGTSTASASDRFTYRPVVSGLAPASGTRAGGTKVTIRGAGFATEASATAVRFGSLAATQVSCPSSSECTALAPAHASGTVAVRVLVAGQLSAQAASDRYTYT